MFNSLKIAKIILFVSVGLFVYSIISDISFVKYLLETPMLFLLILFIGCFPVLILFCLIFSPIVGVIFIFKLFSFLKKYKFVIRLTNLKIYQKISKKA